MLAEEDSRVEEHRINCEQTKCAVEGPVVNRIADCTIDRHKVVRLMMPKQPSSAAVGLLRRMDRERFERAD